MITVEIRDVERVKEGAAKVEIFCDSEGLELLSKQIAHLRSGSGHVHLMTPAWAGNELDEKKLGGGTDLVNHLRITLVK